MGSKLISPGGGAMKGADNLNDGVKMSYEQKCGISKWVRKKHTWPYSLSILLLQYLSYSSQLVIKALAQLLYFCTDMYPGIGNHAEDTLDMPEE